MTAFLNALLNPFNVFFIVCILVYFFAASLALRKQYQTQIVSSKNTKLISSAPSILTSIGVLGTFVGIFLGLLQFQVEDIDKSVPLLLRGLKTAFLTSVVGLTMSIIFRMCIALSANRFERKSVSESPLDALNLISSSIEKQTSALVGNEDQSVLSQLKNMRTDLRDQSDLTQKYIKSGFESQIIAFQSFAEKMAENNSQALIEALEKVIQDFNENLTEQFGQNFAQLNTAVGNLLEWQERYKKHIETMEDAIAKAVLGIGETQLALKAIEESAQNIPVTMSSLDNTVKLAATSIGAVGGLLTAVDGLGKKAGEALPVIEDNLDSITSTLKSAAENQAKILTDTNDEMNASMSETLNAMQDNMQKNFEAFDQQMQDELQRSLQLMGQNLAAISEKMTSDYEQFADAAKRVIEASGGF